MTILIVAAGNCLDYDKLLKNAKASDYIICADGGYKHLSKIGIKPDLLVGDFDSLNFFNLSAEKPDIKNIIKLPVEKDETDTLFALKKAFEKNADKIIIYAGLGTRFDHSYANVCLLDLCLKNKILATVTDGYNSVYLIDDEISFKNEKGKTVSIYSFSEKCEGIISKGLKYPLNNYTLEKTDIIGTSNIIEDDEAFIKINSGKLLVICNEKENI